MCGGAIAAVLTCQLVQMFHNFKGRCSPPFLTCWDMTSVSCVSPAEADNITDTQTRAAPQAAAQLGALRKSLGKLLWPQPAAIRMMLMTLC